MTVYRTLSGRPEPRGVIKMLPGLTDPPHYSFRSDSDAPYRSWDISVPLANIMEEMTVEGWECVLRHNAMGFSIVECVHLPTLQALKEEK